MEFWRGLIELDKKRVFSRAACSGANPFPTSSLGQLGLSLSGFRYRIEIRFEICDERNQTLRHLLSYGKCYQCLQKMTTSQAINQSIQPAFMHSVRDAAVLCIAGIACSALPPPGGCGFRDLEALPFVAIGQAQRMAVVHGGDI